GRSKAIGAGLRRSGSVHGSDGRRSIALPRRFGARGAFLADEERRTELAERRRAAPGRFRTVGVAMASDGAEAVEAGAARSALARGFRAKLTARVGVDAADPVGRAILGTVAARLERQTLGAAANAGRAEQGTRAAE